MGFLKMNPVVIENKDLRINRMKLGFGLNEWSAYQSIFVRSLTYLSELVCTSIHY